MVRRDMSYVARLIVWQENRVTDVDRSARNYFGAEAAAMNQAAQRAAFSQSLQVRARFAESRPPEPHLADQKFPIDQVIEGHVSSHNIAPRLSGRNVNAVVPLEALERFDLYQCHMTTATGIAGVGAE